MDRERKLKLAELKKQKAKEEKDLKAEQSAVRKQEQKANQQREEQFLRETKGYIDHLIEGLKVILDDQVSQSYDKLNGLYEKLEKNDQSTKQEANDIRKQIIDLTKVITGGLTVSNIKEAKAEVKTKEYKLELPKWLESNKDFVDIKNGLAMLIEKASNPPTVQVTPESQKAPDFLPFRRVVKDGRGLRFDDTPSGFISGGGSNGGGSSSAGLTDAELRATPVDVSVTEPLSVDDNGGSLTIDAVSLPLPAGAATSANQQTDALTDAELRASPLEVSQAPDTEIYENNTPLGSNASVASAWLDVEDYAYLDAILFTDVNSATNGAVIMLSADGGTTTHKSLANTITGGLGAYGYSIPLTGYNAIKFSYTNGAVAQAAFHIRILGGQGANPIALAPLGAGINPTLSGLLTRAVIAGQTVSGTMSNIVLTASGNVPINIAEATAEVPIKALTTLNVGQQSITASASQITSAATGRNTVSIKALVANTAEIYIGTTSGVTASNGYELAAGDAVEFDLTEGQALYAISASGTQGLCKAEIS